MKITSAIFLKLVIAAMAVISAADAVALPDLTPYQPSGWSDKIVVSRTSNSTTDSTSLTTTDTLYVDWAVANFGTTAATNAFQIYLYVDGVFRNGWPVASMAANNYTYATGYSIGSLSAGTHTVTVTADATGTVVESNESNNSYTKTITIGNANEPNLTPYQPAGWSDKIVVARTTGTTTDSTALTTADPLYVNWAVINNGGGSVTNTFSTYLYIDGTLQSSWSTPPPLVVGGVVAVTNYFIGSLAPGSHAIMITADATGKVAEQNESDNSYTKTIAVSAPNLTAPVPQTPISGATNQLTFPTFVWSPVAGAAYYRIFITTSAADLPTDPTAANGGPSTVTNAVPSLPSFTQANPLNTNTTYYWEVQARATNQYGVWSDVSSFKTGPTPTGLTIIPIFDSSITNDPEAATIEATIYQAIAAYQTNIANPQSVSIDFQETTSGLGYNGTHYNIFPYSQYRAALASHATSVDDATALAHLPNATDNPVNGNTDVALNLSLAVALGFSGPSVTLPAGETEGTIYLNTSLMNLSPDVTDPDKYSLYSTASHEIDEVLGLGSILNGASNGDPVPTGPIEPEDLFRYDQTGARTLSTDVNATTYFSLDGTTHLDQFNQYDGGDFGDWYSFYGGVTPEVQDAFLAPGANPVLGVELRVLDVIGYTRIFWETITASAGLGGAISPNGVFGKNPGTSQVFTAIPLPGFTINQWLVDGNVVQTGGSSYTLSNIQVAHSVQVTFTQTIVTLNQTITFAPPANQTFGEPPFALSATASSGLPVSFAILSGPATISGTNVTLTGTGVVTVQASQGGSVLYTPAPNVDQSFTVYPPPVIGSTRSGRSLILNWSTNVPGYTLQSATNLAPPVAWIAVTPSPVIVNGQYSFTNAPAGGNLYYRLKK